MARFRLIEGPVPLHHQVYLDLRDALDAGEWKPGEQLPPERELADRYGVSLITLRRAPTGPAPRAPPRRAPGALARGRGLARPGGGGPWGPPPPIALDLDAPVSFTEDI